MTSTITIQHRGGFESTLGKLRAKLDELDRANDPAEFTAALNAAASGAAPTAGLASLTAGLGRREPTATGAAAPVYAGTVAAVGTMTEAAQAHIKAARQSVAAAISDLESLLSRLDDTDTTAAAKIGAS
ncbi:hypothetical protein H7J08_01005 [Mycobacterium frederiksbergense]|uniref:hypothetical protein n=1 Tax=Mycolicibacterium frederiksbergense TaxID=117567 RepID=UPI0021F3A895|nr:hypothetical protein [Mycolicibacterium frederiksbergense]MCV7043256.1 hypothetical protein [Mycolicibacterium frederiksbergense]